MPKVRLRRVKEQQAESEVLISRSSCSIHSRKSVVSASEMSHERCEVSLKIDRTTAVTMSRRGARGHITKRKDETIHTTTWTTHHQTPRRSTTQHSTSWRSATDAILPAHREQTGGSRQDTHGTTRADYDQEAVGGSTSRARARDISHRHTSCEHVWRPNSLAVEYMVAKPCCELRQPTRVQITRTWQQSTRTGLHEHFHCFARGSLRVPWCLQVCVWYGHKHSSLGLL